MTWLVTPGARPGRSRAAKVVMVAVTTALVGCTTATTGAPTAGSGTASSGASSASRSSGPSQGSPAASATAGTTTAAATSTSGIPSCSAGQLRVTSGPIGEGAGQRYLPIVFRNITGRACTLYGYPGVAGLNAAGHQLAQARRESGWQTTGIVLSPLGAASAIVQATVVPSGSTVCPAPYASLLVTPPNTTSSVHLSASMPSCGGLTVRPVVTGTSGL